MDVRASDLEPETPFSPPLSRPGKPESGNKPPFATDQHVEIPDWDGSKDSDESYDSTSASPSSDEPETDRNGANCDKMVEKWRLIRLADRNRPQKKIYPTHDVYAALFGDNYSKVYEAFQQGITTSQAPKPTATTVPAKRSAAASKQASKRRRQDVRASRPQLDKHQARTIPAQISAATTTKTSPGAKPTEPASLSDVAREPLVISRPRPQSEAKEQPSRRKGVGLYAGNWDYATDEEKVPEYLSVVQKTADFEGRTTRRAYAKITSKEGAGDSGKLVGLSPGSEVRKSGRARNAVDYSKLFGSEDNAHGIAAPEQIEEGDISRAQETEQISPSMSASSTSNRSTLMPDHARRSISTSTSMTTEQPERPKLSWNAIVYEVLATSETPLTFPQLVQGVKDRFPFFKSSSQDKVLESGVKNPLYFHEAFCKGEMINGKQTWGLKPGDFVDKKTGEVLTPRPRHTITSPRITEQRHEMEDQSPVNLASKLSHSYNPRSSNPRFGREILNSPEIPDSQEAKVTTSSPQEADSRIATEHAPHLDERTGAQEIADTADGTSAIAFIGTSLSGQTPQPRFQWPTATGNRTNTTSPINLPIAAGTKVQSIQNLTGSTDHEASAIGAQPPSTIQATQPRISAIPSPTGESGRGNRSPTIQVVSTPVPLVHTVSTTCVPAVVGGCAATPQAPPIAPAASMPSVSPLASTQLDGFLPDGKAGVKENAYVHSQ